MSDLARFAPRPRQLLIALSIAAVLMAVFVGVVYARTGIPSPSAIASQQTTTLYYSDGKTPLARIGTTNRTDVTLAQVPIDVQHAVLAAEDRQFYSEPGVSPTGILRALFVDLRGGDVSQGGSTITQQYAKNAYLSQQRSLTRKLKEIVIASKLGQSRSKSTILEDYLNTIYFGRDAYGIDAAAHAYFGVPSSRLTTAQGAVLAAVIRAPNYYDPRVNKAAAQGRFGYVLSGMVKQHWLSPARAATLRLPHTIGSQGTQANCTLSTCYIRDAVEHELLTTDGFSRSQLEQGGYRIVTTIDKTAQNGLVAAERSVIPPNRTGMPESGAASIKPGDGAVEALYGGTRYCQNTKRDPDACVDLSGYTGQLGRPGGSSFKAFTLIAALQKGIALTSTFDGPYQVDVNGTTIHNSSPGEACYGCTLLNAFAKSINTIFVPLAQQVGPSAVVKAAYDAGIPRSAALQAVPDVTLGPFDVAPISMADAYATIAAQGVHATPYLVKNVTTTTGQHVYSAHQHTSRVFPADVMADTTYAMTKVLAPGGTAYGHALTGRPAAGKTGTTDLNTNAWFTGFTPQLCTSVWIGNSHRKQTIQGAGVGEVFGGTLPAEIWQQAMNAALVGQPVLQFPTPAGVGAAESSATPTATATRTTTASPSKSGSASPSASRSSSPTAKPSSSASLPVSPSPTHGSASPHGTQAAPPTKHARPR